MTIAAVLLAAGTSQRFGGGNKLAAMVGGLPLGLHAARTIAGLPLDRHVVVTTSSAIAWPGFERIENSDPAAGLSRSLALGVAAARTSGPAALLVALADMPLVPASHFMRLLSLGTHRASLVATADRTRRMPPALFGADWFDTLEALSGDQGARRLLDRADAVAADPADLVDVDRVADLVTIERRLAARS